MTSWTGRGADLGRDRGWSLPAVAGEPQLRARPSLVAGLVTLLGTLFTGVVVAPWVSDALAGLNDLQAFGASLLLASSVRVAAGAYAARAYRRAAGTQWRHEPVLCVLVGVLAAWVAYAALVLLSSGAAGGGWSWLVLLELPRWAVEAVVGMYLVTPGEAEDDRATARRARLGGRW